MKSPRDYPIDDDLIEYLCDEVAGLNRAQTLITQCAAAKNHWDIYKFCSYPAAGWLHNKKLIQVKCLVNKQPKLRGKRSL